MTLSFSFADGASAADGEVVGHINEIKVGGVGITPESVTAAMCQSGPLRMSLFLSSVAFTTDPDMRLSGKLMNFLPVLSASEFMVGFADIEACLRRIRRRRTPALSLRRQHLGRLSRGGCHTAATGRQAPTTST